MPVCSAGCLMIANISSYASLIIRNTAILENNFFFCIVPHKLVNTCDLHLVKCTIFSKIPVKMVSFKSLLNFKIFFFLIYKTVFVPTRLFRHTVG